PMLLSTPRRPTTSTLFPYTTLFRSEIHSDSHVHHGARSAPRAETWRHAERRGVQPLIQPRYIFLHRFAHLILRVGVQVRQRPHRSEEHTSELQSLRHLVCRLLLEKK